MRQILWFLLLCAGLNPGSRVYGQYLLNNPESVIYDSAHQRYLVSNMSSGDIIAIDEYGSYSMLFDGLQGAYGMAIADNTLFVSSYGGPTTGIVGIDLDNPAIVYHRPTTTYGENGITADTSGNVYFADTGGNCIRGIRVANWSSFYLTTISQPNAVFFDARHNRLLATSNVWWTPVYGVSLPGGTVTPVTTITGQFSGLAEDAMHNLYVAFFNHNQIFRLDSTLQGTPAAWRSGFNGPEGISFNTLYSTLAVPNLLGNRIDFIPVDVDVWLTSDATPDWVPREVSFSGHSVFEIANWVWDFGDGDSAFVQNPIHQYIMGGYHDVSVMAVTTQQDTLRRVYPNYMQNFADSVWAEVTYHDSPGPYTVVRVTVMAHNNAPLRRVVIPMEYSGSLPLTYSSHSVQGCRSQAFDQVAIVDSSRAAKHLAFELIPRSYGSPFYLPPGRGPVLTVDFFLTGGSIPQATNILLEGYGSSYSPEFESPGLAYNPVSVAAKVEFPCCIGPVGDANTTGNVNASGVVDLVDLTALVSYLTGSGYVLPCFDAANVNGVGIVDLADLSALVSYLTGGGYVLPHCP